jgi:NADH dehydrogenase/NADH:ubiquinone oxidoreductase subunit G
LKKKIVIKKNNFFWFNSHGSLLASRANLIVPLLSEFEDERLVLNTECRPQKTNKTFGSFFDGRSLKTILFSLFEKIDFKSESFFKHLEETIENPSLFDKSVYLYTSLLYNTPALKRVSKFPIKSTLEDFYCSTKTTKNSKVMLESSQYLRKISSNFR